MEKEEILFNSITEKLSKTHHLVTRGKMMSAPGIRYKNKVFAFYYDKEMIFRLGKDFGPETFGVKKYRLLNPFKNKAAMKNWFQIPFSEKAKWEKLVIYALNVLSDELKKSK